MRLKFDKQYELLNLAQGTYGTTLHVKFLHQNGYIDYIPNSTKTPVSMYIVTGKEEYHFVYEDEYLFTLKAISLGSSNKYYEQFKVFDGIFVKALENTNKYKVFGTAVKVANKLYNTALHNKNIYSIAAIEFLLDTKINEILLTIKHDFDKVVIRLLETVFKDTVDINKKIIKDVLSIIYSNNKKYFNNLILKDILKIQQKYEVKLIECNDTGIVVTLHTTKDSSPFFKITIPYLVYLYTKFTKKTYYVT